MINDEFFDIIIKKYIKLQILLILEMFKFFSNFNILSLTDCSYLSEILNIF